MNITTAIHDSPSSSTAYPIISNPTASPTTTSFVDAIEEIGIRNHDSDLNPHLYSDPTFSLSFPHTNCTSQT